MISLNHPNIIKTYGIFVGDIDSYPAILLEYCKYNLKNIIDELTNSEIVCIIYQICSAMKYVHDKNFMHRDLKVSNILLDDNKNVKICDFGLANSTNTDFSLTNGIGTFRFMAPELLYENRYNEKVDVYSFGVIMYFLLINNLSETIIRRCWSYLPEERPSFGDLVNEIVRNNFLLINGIESDIRQIRIHLGL